LTNFRLKNLKKNFLPQIIEILIPFNNLPNDWKFYNMESITFKITDGEHFRPKTQESGIPFLSAKDIRENGPRFENCLFVNEKDAEKFRKRCNPENNDILMVSRGATIGRVCINNTKEKFCLLGSVILMKLKPKINPEYVLSCLKTNPIQKKLLELSGSSAQQAIYLTHLRDLEIPIPIVEDKQKKIVKEVKKAEASVVDTTEKLNQILTRQEFVTKHLEHLQKSILDKALSGKLVN